MGEVWPARAELETDGMGFVVLAGQRQVPPIRTPESLRGFHKGDRVRLTEIAIRAFPRSTTRRGIVATEPRRSGHSLMVTADGAHWPKSWAREFWELDTGG